MAAGVSDLEVYDEVHARLGTSLWLCAELHAKYYRSDERVLVGSANLTATALGWAPTSNLELLVEPDWRGTQREEFERRLAWRSVPATVEMRDRIREAAAAFSSAIAPEPSSAVSWPTPGVTWIPNARHPEGLFRAYSGRSADLTSSGQEQTLMDLAALGIPPGLAESEFRRFVGSMLLQTPLVVALDRSLDRPRRYGELRELVGQRLELDGLTRDSAEVWQTLMRWLLLFLPDRYACQTPRYSEVFSRRGPVD